jgi:shikimate kinase
MKLIFLYGPPASGKLTIGKILHDKIGYKLFHNHMLVNVLKEIFGYNNPSRRKLIREFRLKIVEEAVQNNINLIFTIGTAGENLFAHYDEIVEIVKKNGGEVCFVHLFADKETLLYRVNDMTREELGKNFSADVLREKMFHYPEMFDMYPKVEHLTIDTGSTTPMNAALKIKQYYNLEA